MRNYATVQKTPTAYITKGKQRIRQHEGTVYLQDGETFEIELYNPTQNDILAKIDLNQQSIGGGGIVLRPGERVFLERYLDSNNKFLFQTYKVEDSVENEFATYKNGWVSVTFHKEKQYPNYPSGNITWNNTNPWYQYYNHTGNPNPADFIGTTSFGTSDVTFTTTTMGNMDTSNFMETGKIEKGDTSNQNFNTVDKQFDTFSFHNVHWRILPKSREVVTAKQLNKRYCTECGARVKKSSFKFCPHCGTKVD